MSDEMTAEEFDQLAEAGEPVELNVSLSREPVRSLEAQIKMVKHLVCICDEADCPRVQEVDTLIELLWKAAWRDARRGIAGAIAQDIENEARAWARRPVSADRPNTVGNGLNMARKIALRRAES